MKPNTTIKYMAEAAAMARAVEAEEGTNMTLKYDVEKMREKRQRQALKSARIYRRYLKNQRRKENENSQSIKL